MNKGSVARISGTGRTSGIGAECSALADRLNDMSVGALSRMFDPQRQMFVFRLRRNGTAGTKREGLSPRYTAIALLGMASLPDDQIRRILQGSTRESVLRRLLGQAAHSQNLGDVALSALAGAEVAIADLKPVLDRLETLWLADREHPIVEAAWALWALSDLGRPELDELRDRVAQRLVTAYSAESRLFPHGIGRTMTARAHVTCFADLIYPIHALARYSVASGSQHALDIASDCALHLCRLQGAAGQWWWHYDYRTGHVLERYPVYAIHQDAMAPMGLFALCDAGGPDCSQEIRRGLEWLASAPELGGRSLIDDAAGVVWRKVARREPLKAVRYLQAIASRVHPSLRVPGMDTLFPARAIDYEDRPYHQGWFLYAWRGERGGAIQRREQGA